MVNLNMTFLQNRATEWVSQDLQPLVLVIFVLVAVARFFYILWPKYRVFKQVPSEDRFNKPITRLWNTVRIAIFQTKMFKEAKSG